jgi:8-oxo-dGTP pyrophosphatase MutT (NUDIX family)
MTWKKLSSKKMYENRYMKVFEEELVTEHGDQLTYGIVRKEPFVVIIPWDGEKVLLVGQYRYAVDHFSWEFPMGHAEKLGINEAALAELQQETGLIAKKIKEIATFHPAPSHLTQVGHIFVATEYEIGKKDLEPSEMGMQDKWVTLKELDEMIANGTIKDGPTLTSLKHFELYLASKKSGV